MNDDPARPDPDRLLETLVREEQRARRGKLKIFFGASAGVGKTYSMLEAARVAKAGGVDVVVGYVEPHGRVETERLLEGLEQLPTMRVRYRGIVWPEFDLDAALARRAAVTLVDELAHSNLVEGEPRPRHPKRWQDIEDLLTAGLEVWTTVNVQHLESLNDVVAGITGVRQTETVPDHVFDDASDIELIDLPPDELLERLKAGKVYVPEQAGVALERFFRKPNLIALRELALRRTADRVDAAALEYAERERSSRPLLARDRFLLAVAPDEQAESLIRFGKRFADALDAAWTVVSVETPAMQRLDDAARNRRIDALRLAESLGAETVTLDGPTPAAAILEYARLRHATRVVVGEPRRRGWRAWLRPSTAVQLLRRPHGLDVSVIARRNRDAAGDLPRRDADARQSEVVPWRRYGWAVAISLACTALAAALSPVLSPTNLAMIYLLGAAVAGLRLGRGPAALSAVLNVAFFDFFFVPPQLTFAVRDVEYLITLAVMLLVAVIIATQTANVRQQNRVAGARERRTAQLYAMSRELAGARGREAMARIATQHVAETFQARVALLLPDQAGRLQVVRADSDALTYGNVDSSIAQWVHEHGRPAGVGTDALPGSPAMHLPLAGSERTLGVLAVLPKNPRRVLLPEQRHLLETFAAQIALAFERTMLAESAEVARVNAETEAVRNTLLASISHDVRTPLAVITGASSALADTSLTLDDAARADLATTIAKKAREVSALISNVLDLMRFESGRVPLRRDWESVDELVSLAVSRIESHMGSRKLDVLLPDDLPPVWVDATLMTQVFANLLENAAKHTPDTTTVTISAAPEFGELQVVVEDDGPGLPSGDPDRLFAKFQRGRAETDVPGAGLGLAICRAIISAHGGRISASNRPGGGARFEFTLPTAENP